MVLRSVYPMFKFVSSNDKNWSLDIPLSSQILTVLMQSGKHLEAYTIIWETMPAPLGNVAGKF